MNIGRPLSGYLPLSGGTLTGALVISANASPLLTVIRPDGAAAVGLQIQSAGVSTARFNTDEGRMTLGIVPLDRVKRVEVTGTNAGAVVVTAIQTTVVSLDLGTVVAGDRILLFADVLGTKGGTAGSTRWNFRDTAGAATVLFTHDETETVVEDDMVAAGAAKEWVLAGVALVTVGGTLTISLRGNSVGSDTTVAVGIADMYALVVGNG